MFQMASLAIETHIDSRIHGCIAQGGKVLYANDDRLAIQIVAASNKLLLGIDCALLRGDIVEQQTEASLVRHGDRHSVRGKEENAFAASRQKADLRNGLAAVGFKS